KPQQQDPWGPPPYSSTPAPVELPGSVPDYSPSRPRSRSSARSSRNASADDSQYAFLGQFDTIFLVDDSGSMEGRRWREAEAAIAAITPICTQHDTDGIDIYFLNHRNRATQSGAYTNITTPSAVQHIFRQVRPQGMTPVGQRLRNVLLPYLKRVRTMAENTNDYGELKNQNLAVRPINIIAITDGAFSDDVESVVLNAARNLDKANVVPWQVGIQFFQIGNDPYARRDLEQLDDGLCQAMRSEPVRDIVDTVPWKGGSGETISADYLLKVVLGSVNKKLDRQRG
ncbi:hypothetical protein BGW36DRAFT_257949, partial [Talaromyces proteolyticus]